MTEKVRALMLEQSERMLAWAKDHPRWPGILAKTNLVDQEYVPRSGPIRLDNNLALFKKMDEETNAREIAFWEERVRHYKGRKAA